MSKKSIMILILALLILFTCLIRLLLGMPKTINDTETQKNCEHEFVMVSEYNYWFRSYEIYSKCSKCGKEIK